MEELLRTNKIEIIHFDTLPLSIYLRDDRQIVNCKTVLVNHNVETERLYSFLCQKKHLIKLFWYLQYIKLKRFEKSTAELFDIHIVVSEKDEQTFLRLYGNKNIRIIPNGVDIDYFKPGNGTLDKKSLVWVGAMNDSYNQDAVSYYLSEVYPLIKQEVPDVKTCFIGKNPIKKLLRIAEGDGNIKVLGFVDDIRSYVAKSIVFIAPIRCGGGTKLKVLNALAQGKAVVTTPIGAEGIDVMHGHNILVADSARDFATNVVSMLKEPEKAKIIGDNGRKLIESQYDWNNIGDRMESVYRELRNSHQ